MCVIIHVYCYIGTSVDGRLPCPSDMPSLLSLSLSLSLSVSSQVSQICVAFAAVVTALHCERSYTIENVSVKDMPVSEEMRSSQVF